MRTDVYQRITDQIVEELEKGVRPWMKPWSAGHTAGRITRPLPLQWHSLQGHQCSDAVVGGAWRRDTPRRSG